MHRLKNDVGSIRAVAQDLLTDLQSPSPPDASDLEARLRMIGIDADRAMEIPNELRRRIVAPQESVDVNAQVEAGIAVVRIPRHVRLVTDLARGLPAIPCTALDLVVENLLLNAVKAIGNKSGTVSVKTWLDPRLPREQFIAVTVEDTGVGMTEEEMGRLFEPRQAGHRGGGLGFGMMWVRGWVRRAHGLIDVKSEPGVGTTVDIRFQIHSRQIDEMPQGGEPT
jgi:signal transduction histidine kinase